MKVEEERPVEFAATFAALQPDSPLLARSLYLYRINNRLSVEQIANWLGLTESEDFYRLAVCLAPRPAIAAMGWKEYTANLIKCFPTIKLNRLQIVVEIAQPHNYKALTAVMGAAI